MFCVMLNVFVICFVDGNEFVVVWRLVLEFINKLIVLVLIC